jgi:polyisoprenoid-binding protein YceI
MNSYKRILALLLLLSSLAVMANSPARTAARPAAPSPTITYRVSRTYSNVSFTIFKWAVLKEEGLFRDFSGEIALNRALPTLSSVNLAVQVASIDTRNDTRDGVLRSDDFFDAAKFPAMTFQSKKVEPAGPGAYTVTGDLTIHGITKQITIPVKFNGANTVQGVGELAGFETSFGIDRSDYGVNGSRWSGGNLVLSKEVQIHLTIGAVRQ